jgi:hypothetical protein
LTTPRTRTAKEPNTNGQPKPKPDPRIKVLETEVAQLRHDFDELKTGFEQFITQMKIALVKQLVQRPDVQATIEQALLAKLDQTPPA